MVTLYTTHCPKCKVLETKLKQKSIEYEEIDNVDEMMKLGISSAPMLKIEDGTIFNFAVAVKWVNKQESRGELNEY